MVSALRQTEIVSDPTNALAMVDGGAFDWLAKLCSNQRAVFVAAGGGVQLIPLRFTRPAFGP